MSDFVVQCWTGIAGIGCVVLNMIVIPLYFIYSGPPPTRNVLTRLLVGMIALVGLTAFLVGFRNTILQARPDYEWLGTLCLTVVWPIRY